MDLSPAAERLATEGGLVEVTKYLTFTQLKLLREVCSSWCHVASIDPRFVNCTGKFGHDWPQEASGMCFAQCHRFRSYHFRYFPFERNTVFEPYLRQAGTMITKLKFKFAKLDCLDMVKFLQRCPHLQEAVFQQCNFRLVEFRRVFVAPRPGRPRVEVAQRTCCLHAGGLRDVRQTQDVEAITPRIHSLRFKGQNFFPNCVMDLLTERSTGVLRTFTAEDLSMPRWKRDHLFPTKGVLDEKFVELIRRNQATIEHFRFFKNHRGDQFLETCVTARIRLNRAREVHVGQKSSWDHMQTFRPFLQFVEQVAPDTLEVLSIRFIHSIDVGHLERTLRAKPNLRKLTVDTIWSQWNDAGGLNWPALMDVWPHMESLDVWDRNRRQRQSMNFNYMHMLPGTLKSFRFFHYYQPIDQVRQLIVGGLARSLKALHIESGKEFNNAMMQTIIRELVNLEELSVANSRLLTDAGVTGAREDIVKLLIKCKSSIMYNHQLGPEGRQPNALPVSNLRKLKKLSFCMSRRVSDISIYLGIRCPLLQEVNLSWCLDVTDIGIYHLVKNNPSLERVVLMKNRKITHWGLNRLVTDFPTIKNIHTSRSCRDRKMGKQLQYTESPRFKKIVTFHKWCEKRPTEYGED